MISWGDLHIVYCEIIKCGWYRVLHPNLEMCQWGIRSRVVVLLRLACPLGSDYSVHTLRHTVVPYHKKQKEKVEKLLNWENDNLSGT